MALAAYFNCEERVRGGALNFQAERECFTLLRGPQRVMKSLAEIGLGLEQLQGAIIEPEPVHAARPPSFGSKGMEAGRACSLGFAATKAQPYSRARRRISKMRNGSAEAG
ncbi:hypothetical protein D3C76_1120960 [compost metagenome]